MEETFRLIYTGKLHAGFDAEGVAVEFGRKFGLDPERAGEIVRGDREMVLRKSAPREKAYKMGSALEAIGMQVRLERLSDVASTDGLTLLPMEGETRADASGEESPPEPEKTAKTDAFACPKCRFEQEKGDECLRCGVIFSKYEAAVAAGLTGERPVVDTSDDEDDASWLDGLELKTVLGGIAAVLLVGYLGMKIWGEDPVKVEVREMMTSFCFGDSTCEAAITDQLDDCWDRNDMSEHSDTLRNMTSPSELKQAEPALIEFLACFSGVDAGDFEVATTFN